MAISSSDLTRLSPVSDLAALGSSAGARSLAGRPAEATERRQAGDQVSLSTTARTLAQVARESEQSPELQLSPEQLRALISPDNALKSSQAPVDSSITSEEHHVG